MTDPIDPDDFREDDEFPDFATMSEGRVNDFLGRARKVDDRIELVWRLGTLCSTSDTAYATLLRTACDDRSPKVRAEAMQTLVQAGDLTPAAFLTLVRHLESEKSAEVRLAALDLFGAHQVGRPGFEDAIPAVMLIWARARGDSRDQADQVVREMTGRSAKEWTPRERAALEQGVAPAAVARTGAGCLAVVMLVVGTGVLSLLGG